MPNFFRRPVARAVAWLGIGLGLLSHSLTGQDSPTGDEILTPPGSHPREWLGPCQVNEAWRTGLRAEALAGRLKVFWEQPPQPNQEAPLLYFSTETAGHWPARDWRRIELSPRRTRWDAEIPVESTATPVVYFLASPAGESPTQVSPMRLCHPNLLGLTQPSQPFWAFLEGFEESSQGWFRVETEGLTPQGLIRSAPGRTGKHALQLAIPPNRGSVTVATTRVRGENAINRQAWGFRLWARAPKTPGRLRVTLLAQAYSDQQNLRLARQEWPLTEDWAPVEIEFKSLPGFSVAQLDLVTFEFLGATGAVLELDDLRLVGPWRILVE